MELYNNRGFVIAAGRIESVELQDTGHYVVTATDSSSRKHVSRFTGRHAETLKRLLYRPRDGEPFIVSGYLKDGVINVYQFILCGGSMSDQRMLTPDGQTLTVIAGKICRNPQVAAMRNEEGKMIPLDIFSLFYPKQGISHFWKVCFQDRLSVKYHSAIKPASFVVVLGIEKEQKESDRFMLGMSMAII